MTDEAREFLRGEYDALHKMAYESQFNHFMGVFYFWIAVVTFPATAGLIASSGTFEQFGSLLVLLAILGAFLSTKMFDIRCSQLKYIVMMNEIRYHLHSDVKNDLPRDFDLPFDRNADLRKVALTDFGMAMAVVMSLVNGAYAFSAAKLLGASSCPASLLGVGFALFCLGLYVAFILKKVPRPIVSPNPPMQPTGSAGG